ncbi:MAG TPA: iron-sulfur cluster assembly accessory protein [Verrucomicrobiae bacterium]|jgi:iron-sulfur cluster assembly accessory protein|nr:iron-sulfur cluster assembly accessory protein [Verrucomicrobiae bacterium]
MNAVAENPVITLTESAAEEIRAKVAAEPQNAGKSLRIYVEKGGCSGMQYGMTFDEKREGDFEGVYFGVSVLVDAFSATYVRGTVVDYSDALTGGGFKITNPQAAQSCGCGRSFDTSAPA